jgi:hypothetical protein
MLRTGDLSVQESRDEGRDDERHAGVALGTRTTGPVIAGDRGEDWRVAGSRLRAFLRSRGASPWLAEDLAQETLLRAVVHEVGFSDADDLLRWCVPVARNLLVDAARRTTRVDGAEVPDGASHVDVEREVMARLELGEVRRQLPRLSDADRQAILSAVEGVAPPAERKAAVGEAVRRHRARQRLTRLVAGAAALWGWAWARRPRATAATAVVALPALTLTALWQAPAIDAAPGPRHAATLESEPTGGGPSGTPVSGPVAAASLPAGAEEGAARHVDAARTRATIAGGSAAGQQLSLRPVHRPADGVVVCFEGFHPAADGCLGVPEVEALPVGADVTVSVDRG